MSVGNDDFSRIDRLMIPMRWFMALPVTHGLTLGGPSISPAIKSKLVKSVFDQRSSLMVGASSTIVFGVVCCARSGQPFFVAWTSLSLLVFAGRLVEASAYQTRAAADDPLLWANRFVVGAALTGLLWGIGPAFAILYCDPLLQLTIMTGQCAYLTVACARNNAIPESALAQCMLAILSNMFACFLKGDAFYVIFGILGLSYLAAVTQITTYLYHQTLDLLVSEERAAMIAHELADANAKLLNLTITDGLTGVLNRRGFDEAFAAACDPARRDGTELSVLLLDIDLFKLLNDRVGHQAGDDCLRRLGSLFEASLRCRADLVARYGGEEFAIVLPDTGSNSAMQFAEALRAAVEDLALPNPGSPFGIVTISIGCATLPRGLAVDPDPLMKTADEALYGAKAAGRNRVQSRQPTSTGAAPVDIAA